MREEGPCVLRKRTSSSSPPPPPLSLPPSPGEEVPFPFSLQGVPSFVLTKKTPSFFSQRVRVRENPSLVPSPPPLPPPPPLLPLPPHPPQERDLPTLLAHHLSGVKRALLHSSFLLFLRGGRCTPTFCPCGALLVSQIAKRDPRHLSRRREGTPPFFHRETSLLPVLQREGSTTPRTLRLFFLCFLPHHSFGWWCFPHLLLCVGAAAVPPLLGVVLLPLPALGGAFFLSCLGVVLLSSLGWLPSPPSFWVVLVMGGP